MRIELNIILKAMHGTHKFTTIKSDLPTYISRGEDFELTYPFSLNI